jgi:UDPglucose 6-dehydrogenase
LRLAVIGTGYVGLVAGTCFADCGNDVVCVDADEAKVEALRRGEIPIYEPGLEELVRRNQQENRLAFSTDLPQAVSRAQVIFIAVGTPPSEDGSADLSNVLAVARVIAQHLQEHQVIVIKSTVPPGTAARVAETIKGVTSTGFAIISNPEFLKEGAAIDDFNRPDRILLGGNDQEALEIMKDLYAPFVRTGNPILVMDNVTAELSKYAANAMLATRISFMNEIANVCEKVSADVSIVREAIGLDQRIGHHFLFPGAGYGGSCFPKDVQALVQQGRGLGVSMSVLSAVEELNRDQKAKLFETFLAHYKRKVQGKRVAVWGLAFKPRTDDMREAPSVTLIGKLLEAGCRVCAYDPEAIHTAKSLFGEKIEYAQGNYQACKGADALMVVTEWNEFRRPDFERIRDLMKSPVVMDGRNLYNPARMAALGFTYYSIGRPPVVQEEN